MAQVTLTDDALDDLRSFGGSVQKVLLKAIKKLEVEPEQRGVPLGSAPSGNLTSYRKLVVGDRQYRVIYSVHRDGSVCIVWVIGPRSDAEVYRVAVARLAGLADRRLSARMRSMLDQVYGP